VVCWATEIIFDNRAVSPAFGSIDRICSASLNGPSWIV
jgi:hypothetical protein